MKIGRRAVLLSSLGLVSSLSAWKMGANWPDPSSPSGAAQWLAEMVPEVLGESVKLGHYESFFRRRLQRLPERRRDYLALAEQLEAFCGQANASERKERIRSFVHGPNSARIRELVQFRREVLEHFAHTDAWLQLGYPCMPGRPDPARIPDA